MKKRFLLAAIALIAMIAMAGGSIAYFSAKDETRGVFAIGKVEIELTEPAWDEAKDHVIAPDASFEKDPTVTNTGDNDAYVRVHVNVTQAEDAKTVFGVDDLSELFTGTASGFDAAKWELSGAPTDEADGSATWTFLYKEVLPVSESTGPLFEKVSFPAFDTAKLGTLNEEFVISVTADAVQAATFRTAKEAFEDLDDRN